METNPSFETKLSFACIKPGFSISLRLYREEDNLTIDSLAIQFSTREEAMILYPRVKALMRKLIELIDQIPKCHIHGIRMRPASWGIHEGRTHETDYVCPQCIKERKKDDPIALNAGPILPWNLWWPGSADEKEEPEKAWPLRR